MNIRVLATLLFALICVGRANAQTDTNVINGTLEVGQPTGSAPSQGDVDISGCFKINGTCISGVGSLPFTTQVVDNGVADPIAPVPTAGGTTGATHINFYVVAHDQTTGLTNVSPVGTVTNANATLSGTNNVSVAFTLPTNAKCVDILQGDTAHSATGGLCVTTTPFVATTNTTASYTPPLVNTTSEIVFNDANEGTYFADPASWLRKHSGADWIFTNVGTDSVGSANEFGINIQGGQMAATSSAAAYEKAGLLIEEETNDPSTDGITRDIVGADIRGLISATNSTGRAFGINPQCQIATGGDGICVGEEIDIVNNGTSQPNIDTTTTKIGLQIVNQGTGDTTVGLLLVGGSSNFQTGIFAGSTDINSSAGAFIQYVDSGTGNSYFSVGQDGGTVLGNGSVQPADEGPGTLNAGTAYWAQGTQGVSCSGSPTSSFVSVGGIVTHC